MKGVSLFCSAGIAETYFKENGIDIVVASELIKQRCDLHSWLYKDCKTICGDITDPEVFDKVEKEVKLADCKFLLATPPCQGMSTLGKKEYERLLNYYKVPRVNLKDYEEITCSFDNAFKTFKSLLK